MSEVFKAPLYPVVEVVRAANDGPFRPTEADEEEDTLGPSKIIVSVNFVAKQATNRPTDPPLHDGRLAQLGSLGLHVRVLIGSFKDI